MTAVSRARTWLLTGNSPVKIGIILSLIGLGFLLREASVRGWVDFTVEMRLAAATVFGLAMLAFGWHQRAKRPVYGLSLQGGGIAVLYLATLAAYAVYDLLGAPAALAAVVLITVGAGALAMIQSSLTLAMLGLIGGFSAPLLAFAWPRDHFAVFGFYAVLGVAVVAMGRLKAWPTLVLSGYGFTFVVVGLWLFARQDQDHSDWAQLQPFVAFFVLLYALVPLLWPPVPAAREEPIGFKDPWVTPLVLCTPFAGLAVQALLVGHLRYGAAVSSTVLSVVCAAFHQLSRQQPRQLSRQQPRRPSRRSFRRLSRLVPRRARMDPQIGLAYAVLAVVFSATAVPLFLGASATSAIWAVQGAVLVWASSRWGSRLALLGGALLQVTAAVAYAARIARDATNWDSPAVFGFWAEATPVLNAYSLGAIMLAVGGAVSAACLRRSSHFEAHRTLLATAALAWGAGWFLFAETAAVWLQLGLLPAVALWAIQGAALVWLGSQRRSMPIAVVGTLMQAAASVAAAVKMTADADERSPGSFEFWADSLPVANQYFAVTVLLGCCGLASAVAVSRLVGARDDTWQAVMHWPCALGGSWLLFAETAETWLRLGPAAVSALWVVQGAALVWAACRWRLPSLAVIGLGLQVAAVVAYGYRLAAGTDRSISTFDLWADTLPILNPYFGGAALMAACGLASAVLVHQRVDLGVVRCVVMRTAAAWGVGWLLFAETAELWLRTGPFAVSALWAAQGAALVWLAVRRWSVSGAVLGAAFGTLMQLVAGGICSARLASDSAEYSSTLSFWADVTPMLNPYFAVAIVLAACGLASAVIVCRSASALGDARVPLMWLSLLWGVGWWLFGAAAQLWVTTDDYRLWALSLLAVGTLSAVVAAGRVLQWRELEWAGVLMLPTLAATLAVALVDKPFPSADWGWTAWPFMIAAYAAFLRTGGGKLRVVGQYGGLYCVLSVFVAAEAYGQLAPVAAGEWPWYGAAAALLLWLGASLLARPVTAWVVGDGWRCWLLYGITPVAWTAAVGVAIAAALHHGSVDPLPFLPILNPIDVFAATSVVWLLRWKHEIVAELSDDSDSLTPAVSSLLRLAAAPWLAALSGLGVAVLTMTAARTVHHWTGVAFEPKALVYSTDLQVTVSILWAAVALAAMVVGVRAADRRVWIVGACWMGVVVVKLFLIDLASLAALPKAASFIGVGILLLIVGYLAPVPPSQAKSEPPDDEPADHSDESSGPADTSRP